MNRPRPRRISLLPRTSSPSPSPTRLGETRRFSSQTKNANNVRKPSADSNMSGSITPSSITPKSSVSFDFGEGEGVQRQLSTGSTSNHRLVRNASPALLQQSLSSSEKLDNGTCLFVIHVQTVENIPLKPRDEVRLCWVHNKKADYTPFRKVRGHLSIDFDYIITVNAGPDTKASDGEPVTVAVHLQHKGAKDVLHVVDKIAVQMDLQNPVNGQMGLLTPRRTLFNFHLSMVKGDHALVPPGYPNAALLSLQSFATSAKELEEKTAHAQKQLEYEHTLFVELQAKLKEIQRTLGMAVCMPPGVVDLEKVSRKIH